MSREYKTPKGGFSMGERPVKPDVLLHCTYCNGEFPPPQLRLKSLGQGRYDMVCPPCDPDMRR